MLASSMCREVHFTVLSGTTMTSRAPRCLSGTTMTSRVPRCLFGKPNSKETMEMLREELQMERSKFIKRWGVDPRSGQEDKENSCQRKRHEQSPKKRSNPYSRQTNIHDYWRARKVCEVNKKPLASSMDSSKQQSEAPKTPKTMKPSKTAAQK
ncbi:hypothetical protein E2986_08892 [Frieseomelitta varia]|uniref:Uncharacterized protein n=1 Tax=Frieseomelitta varia TaxID=561572 RepID=A0A833RPG9_9HYME|nr:uncharacterized protein LOC122528582 isoform X1 [Frieseomelitta varia]KAF3427479.1 hypothetical protein E2986_08892 [Frieseomelitta varia]